MITTEATRAASSSQDFAAAPEHPTCELLDMSTPMVGRLAAFHEAHAAYDKAQAAYERASIRDRPAARDALHVARAAMRAALRGES